jgi:hypothetical protein
MGQTSIPLDSEVRDRLATDKPDDVSWSEFLSRLHSDGEIMTGGGVIEGDVEFEPLADAEQLERIEESVATVEERTGRIERMVEEVSGR